MLSRLCGSSGRCTSPQYLQAPGFGGRMAIDPSCRFFKRVSLLCRPCPPPFGPALFLSAGGLPRRARCSSPMITTLRASTRAWRQGAGIEPARLSVRRPGRCAHAAPATRRHGNWHFPRPCNEPAVCPRLSGASVRQKALALRLALFSPFRADGVDDGNRTRTGGLEGRSAAVTLHPHLRRRMQRSMETAFFP